LLSIEIIDVSISGVLFVQPNFLANFDKGSECKICNYGFWHVMSKLGIVKFDEIQIAFLMRNQGHKFKNTSNIFAAFGVCAMCQFS
jgi:hypothetical protein